MTNYTGPQPSDVAKHPDDGAEFPKWVEVHPSHVVTKADGAGPEHISTPGWSDYHVDRVTKVVTVLVKDVAEASRAVAPAEKPAESAGPEHNLDNPT